MDLGFGESAAKRPRLDGGGGEMSEVDILRKVAQREMFRQTRKFAESDAVRQELRDAGVELYDKEREWRSKDGRRGVLFTAGPDESPLGDADIQERIREREEARRQKDWDKANVIRDELRSLGVELSDKEGMWRTIGGRGNTYAATVTTKQVLHGSVISKLIAERERFRAGQDYVAADEVRVKLSEHGVEILDSHRIWKCTDGRQGVIITGGHEAVCVIVDEEIMARVREREEHRLNRNWQAADEVREVLRIQGVEVMDAQRQWLTTDGRNGTYEAAGAPMVPADIGSLLGGASASGFSAASLGALGFGALGGMPAPGMDPAAALRAASAQAGSSKAATDPTATMAAQALSALSGMLARSGQVTTQQLQTMQQLQQSLLTAPQAAPQTSTSGMNFSTASIVALVAGREQARDRRDFTASDCIRTDLRSHGVEVWDKDKVWRSTDGRSGALSAVMGGL